MSSSFSVSSPTPESRTVANTPEALSFSVVTDTSRGPVPTPFKASIALTIRLRKTCCTWTRSAQTSGKSAGSCVFSEMRFCSISLRHRMTISSMASFMFSEVIWGGAFLTSARTRWITSLARLASRIMRFADSVAFSTLGGSLASQRKHAWALLTTPASGWLTSCAIEAVNSPTAATRANLARSARVCCSSSSAILRSLAMRPVMMIEVVKNAIAATPSARLAKLKLNIGRMKK